MRTVDEWKTTLRAALKEALRTRSALASAVLRETLAAIDNAEAPDVSVAPPSVGGTFAGSAGAVGSGEVPRLALTPDAVNAVIEREIQERRDAVALYVKLGRHDEANAVKAQLDVLLAL
ncbi:GatB/YqeY domain-containing protein [Stigmatella sp. ncwal1]|uniref:GatB/YqeY domain-containing protein n=1 Tax=Stigmatella ashevillensis TaxID=2995309 RepID=A0ABT5DG10_9BACT|nr:GatB/YqeY domain-containing protein [Stigmatella ashevillena]MDC0712085.1 GatB/YqeY domain-containing protein [Stigmatella ashevillena]